MPQYNLKWFDLGTSENFNISNEIFDKGGVYLWVHEGSPKRIAYVGTTSCFRKRIGQHVGAYLVGLGSVIKLNKDEDIYYYMQMYGEKYYEKYNEGIIYTPDKIEDISKWTFKEILEALKDYRIWLCPIEDKIAHKYLETQIQYVFKTKFNISYFNIKNKKNNSWLGKMEKHTDKDLLNYVFYFNNLPDIDNESLDLLKDISGSLRKMYLP